MHLDPRKQKGLEIAATMRIRRKENKWLVPSQTNKGYCYTVGLYDDGFSCDCADHDTRRVKCKHIYAVEFRRLRLAPEDKAPCPLRPASVTYRQNWPAYNSAQTNEKERVAELLRGLCDGIAQPPQGRGRPRLPLSDVVFSAVMKVYSTRSGRRSTGEIRECQAKGFLSRAPHYNSVFKYLESTALTAILTSLVEESALPLRAIETDFAADSSGFSTSTFVRWFDAKYGRMQSAHYWVKAHLMIGVRTNIVTTVQMTGPEANDYPLLPHLLQATKKNFNMAEVSADKGYFGRSNLEAIEAVGAAPYIPFKANCTGEGSELWRRLWHLYQFHRLDFLRSYHKRSNVESTFSMIKAKFGASVRSRTPTAQMNEVLCKIVCHNLCVLVQSIYELGIEPHFWANQEHAQKNEAA